MNKLFAILELLLKIIRIFFGKNPKQASTKDENIKAIKAGLDSAPQTKEVIEAKKKIEYIETLTEKERKEKHEEIAEIEKVVKKEVKAKPIDDKRAKSIIEKYKKEGNK